MLSTTLSITKFISIVTFTTCMEHCNIALLSKECLNAIPTNIDPSYLPEHTILVVKRAGHTGLEITETVTKRFNQQ